MNILRYNNIIKCLFKFKEIINFVKLKDILYVDIFFPICAIILYQY